MKVPANVSGDKLILDYLARVTEAGLRYLPKGARIAFVGRTKALIERECGMGGTADPGRVMEVLTSLGEPEELVRQERARIDAEWVKRRAESRDAGAAAAATVAAPREHRPITSRWKPAVDTQPLPQPPIPPGQPVAEPVRGGPGGPGEPDGPQPRPAGYPVEPGGGPWPPPGDWALRLGLLARSVALVARRHPVESAAVILLGVGGVIYPFPFWLLGGLVAVMSRFFDVRDKWIALAGPAALALAGTIITALVVGGQGNAVVVYLHGLELDVGYLLRAGSVLAAAELCWRLRQGPRPRVPPWKRY